MMGGQRLASKSKRSSSQEVRKDDEAGALAKHYPWLRTFDEEAKARLTEPEVSNANVVKLMTMLESLVSPEVTKLRNKPNRATKFLGQVRRRVSMVKMGGYMMERECELQLFPTYGLLMTHIVNITLTSSKIEKYGAQQVAQDLYYFLKLMFQEDNEYILDVVLCSTLDEHATSGHKVGFQLFSFIVEDWRCYNDTHSLQMKYCAVANLLYEGSLDGQRFVERTAPTEVDKTFPKFLAKNLIINFGVTKKKSTFSTLKAIIEAIKVLRVKSISRSRLVVVSKKDIIKSVPEQSPEDVSDAESSISANSTLVNVPMMNDSRRSTSAVQSQPQNNTDPVNSFFSELGIGNFFVDTSGNQNAFQEYGYEREPSEDCLVTSSSVRSNHSHLQVSDIKPEPAVPSYSYSNGDQDMEIEDDGDDDEGDLRDFSEEKSNRSRSRSQNSVSFEEVDQEMNEQERGSLKDEGSLVSGDGGSKDGYSENKEVSDKNKDIIKGYAPMSDSEQNELSDVLADYDYDDDGDPPKSPAISDTTATLKRNGIEDTGDDSDLEIISEKAKSDDDASSTGSGSRDEAEPESGEDYVPNYDVDSDEEVENDLENQEERMEDEDKKNKDEDIPNPADRSTNKSQETLSTPAKNTSELFASQSLKNESGKDLPSPSLMKLGTANDNDDKHQKMRNEGEKPLKISPPLSLRKSARAGVSKGVKVNSKTSNSSVDDKAKPKSKSSKASPPKRMKLISESDENDASDDESQDTVSQSLEPAPQQPSSQLGRGRKSSVSTPKAAVLKIGVDTRRTRTLRSTRSVTPLLHSSKNTPTVPTVTTRRGGRGKVTAPAVETGTKKTPSSTSSRGRPRGRPLSRK